MNAKQVVDLEIQEAGPDITMTPKTPIPVEPAFLLIFSFLAPISDSFAVFGAHFCSPSCLRNLTPYFALFGLW